MALARKLGIADRIVVTGMLPSSEIPSLIQSCDLLVHPSYREGLPRVVVQAMLAGVPVVATDADGTREVCVPEKTGRLVPIGDVEALRSALQDHLDHRAARNNGPKKPKPWSVPSSPSMPWWMRWRRCMPSCWLEAVVLLFGQTFGLAAEDVRPTLTAPTYQTVLREAVEAECQLAGDPDDWPSRARRGWRQLIVAHLKAADQDPAGDRLFARAIRMHSLTSFVDRKIAEGNLALWMQLGIAEPNPATWFRCVVPCSTSPQAFPKRPLGFSNRIWKLIRDGSRSPKIFDNGLIFPVCGIAARPPRKRRLFLSRQAFRRVSWACSGGTIFAMFESVS